MVSCGTESLHGADSLCLCVNVCVCVCVCDAAERKQKERCLGGTENLKLPPGVCMFRYGEERKAWV